MKTVKEVAEFLGLHVSLVRIYCEEGRIRAQKVGRDWVILADDEELQSFKETPRPRGQKPKNREQA